MTRVYCDTFLCACPSVEEGPDRFSSFLEGILTLRDLPQATWLSLCITNESLDALFQEDKYPIRPSLERSLEAYGAEQLQAQDIIGIVNGLFKRVSILESLTGIDDYLYENFTTDPVVHKTGRGVATSAAFDKFILLSAYDSLYGPHRAKPFSVLTQGIVTEGSSARIQGRITYAEGPTLPALPSEIDTFTQLHQNFTGLCAFLATSQGWCECIDARDYAATLQIHLKKTVISLGLPESSIRNWKFGAHFILSFNALGFNDEAKSKKLLKACSEAIIRLNMPATHALRIGAGPDDAQISREVFKAWRRDIDYEYHLHYWDDGSTVELSLVVVHNNFDIW